MTTELVARATQILLERTAHAVGVEFFRALVRGLAETLGTRYALIAEVTEAGGDRRGRVRRARTPRQPGQGPVLHERHPGRGHQLGHHAGRLWIPVGDLAQIPVGHDPLAHPAAFRSGR